MAAKVDAADSHVQLTVDPEYGGDKGASYDLTVSDLTYKVTLDSLSHHDVRVQFEFVM